MPVILAITRYNAGNGTVTTAEIKGIAKKKIFQETKHRKGERNLQFRGCITSLQKLK